MIISLAIWHRQCEKGQINMFVSIRLLYKTKKCTVFVFTTLATL